MATDPNKTVFISYRRSVSRDRAVLIFNYLRKYKYDVFLDVSKIDSGAFDKVILNQIGAKAHFVILLANGSLERCQYEGDWLRREIEEALRLGRNIVPIIDEHFDFEREMSYLPDAWRDQFATLNMLPWVHYYHKAALSDLRKRFLNPPTFPVTFEVSEEEKHEVAQRIAEVIQEPLQKSKEAVAPIEEIPISEDVIEPVDEVVTYIPEDEPTIPADFSADEPMMEQIAEDVAESEFTDVSEVGTYSLSKYILPLRESSTFGEFFDNTTPEIVREDYEQPIISVSAPKIETPPRKIITPYTTSLKIMPKPFEWITIPAGKVTIESYSSSSSYLKENTTFDVPAFQIAKYPTTNAQFDVFINHPDGYKNSQWWDFSEDAKQWRTQNTEPQYKRFDGDNHPRVNVTWYESVAFCLWLSAITDEKMMLPTEQQWQRAAQGDDGREYPWGNRWDRLRCNNSVKNLIGMGGRNSTTTPVTQYEGKGDSPFGVVDMVGNVQEWCSTDWQIGDDDLRRTDDRVVRSCSSYSSDAKWFRTSFRLYNNPEYTHNNSGFRICSL